MTKNRTEVADIDRSLYDFTYGEEGFERLDAGITPDIVREISAKKDEPQWMLDLRLKSLEIFNRFPDPTWGPSIEGLDMDNIVTYVKPNTDQKHDWESVPDDIKNTFERLGIPEAERSYLAGVGAQYDSELVYHNMQDTASKMGIVYSGIEEALHDPQWEPLIHEKFMTLIPPTDHKFAALHGAVWSGGSFVYVPKGTKLDFPLQSYFRLNAKGAGQFEHTLIIVDEGASLHPIDQSRLCQARDTDIDGRIDQEAQEHPQRQGIGDPEGSRIRQPHRRPDLGPGQQDEPDEGACHNPGKRPARMAIPPQDRAEQGRGQLGQGGERSQSDRGQAAGPVHGLKIQPGQKQHRTDDDAPDLKDGPGHVGAVLPRPPAITRHQRQDQAVGRHGGQGHRLHNDHGCRRRKSADEHDGGEQPLALAERQVQHEQVRIGDGREQTPCRQQRDNRQAGDQQIERKDPPRPPDIRRSRRLHEGDVELSGQTENGQGRQKGDGDEAPVQVRHRGQAAQAGGDIRPVRRPQDQQGGKDGDRDQRCQLDDRFQRNGLDQTTIMLRQIRTPGSEQDGESGQHNSDAGHRQPLRSRDRRVGHDQRPGHGQRLQL